MKLLMCPVLFAIFLSFGIARAERLEQAVSPGYKIPKNKLFVKPSLNSDKETEIVKAFALSGGGARAFSHIGILSALKEEGIEPIS